MSDELGTLRNVASLALGSEQRARLVEALAGEQEPIDAQAVLVLSSTLKLAPVGDEGVVGLLLEEIVRRSWRLAQPASRNGSLLGSKRDRKIAASMGSAKQ